MEGDHRRPPRARVFGEARSGIGLRQATHGTLAPPGLQPGEGEAGGAHLPFGVTRGAGPRGARAGDDVQRHLVGNRCADAGGFDLDADDAAATIGHRRVGRITGNGRHVGPGLRCVGKQVVEALDVPPQVRGEGVAGGRRFGET